MVKIKRELFILVAVIISAAALYLLLPDDTGNLGHYGKVIYDRQGKILRAFLNDEQQWCFTPGYQLIPPKLEKAVLFFEDQHFYHHPGINPVSVWYAFIRNIKAGKVVSGGSTITMQVCRLSDPGRRTFFKKFTEMLQAVKLEIKYSKSEILSFYLNNAPYGGNIKGIRAASLKYYQREPQQLSWAEAALLAVLPNEPAQLAPGHNVPALLAKRNRLLYKLHKYNQINDITLKGSLAEPLPVSSSLLPQEAPHFTRLVEAATDEKEIHTTLDLTLQKNTESICQVYQQSLTEIGIRNLAALVTDNQTGEILIWKGSQNFWDDKSSGSVDGVLASRSPGSTLKPLLYALAIDEGLISPDTRIQDVPTFFGAYAPENANHTFSGWVTAHQALVRSLNIPAVRLLNIYGYQRFYRWLEAAGITTLFRSPSAYGLTLIIGGCEVKMLELTALYRTLANYGKYQPLHYLQNITLPEPVNLVSSGASWQVLNMLNDLSRPGNEYYWHQYENQWRLAWKTGTSYGHRDAWAIGVNPQYSIAVWIGNFNGESNNSLAGASIAAPLLFSIFNSLPRDPAQAWFQMPLNEMTERAICSETGLAPSPFCPCDTILVPKDAAPLKVCPYHQPFQVTADGKNTVCSLCWQNKPHHTEVFLIYPPQVKKYLLQSGISCHDIPPHLPLCPTSSKNNLSIIYPTAGAIIFLPRDLNSEQQKLSPQISVNSENLKIFWYLDDEYIGVSTGRENFSILPEAGKHTLTIIDESGNSASSSFRIQRNNSETRSEK
ncbi:MAG: penicillin-binding protein 1C [Candidatus Cloacimonetes bacterium]|nr:penicillin-binding protein 1C [Candidatus Cloacimonadota bacterium]